MLSDLSDEEKAARINYIKQTEELAKLNFSEHKWLESVCPVAKIGYMTAEEERDFRKRYGTYYNSMFIFRIRCNSSRYNCENSKLEILILIVQCYFLKAKAPRVCMNQLSRKCSST